MQLDPRAREPSTWAGVAALVALVWPELREALPSIETNVGLIAGGAAGLAAIIRRERRG